MKNPNTWGVSDQSSAHSADVYELLEDDLLAMAQLSGRPLFEWLISLLARQYNVDLVAIGGLMASKVDRIHVVTGRFDGMSLDEFEFDAQETPCHEVIHQGTAAIIRERVTQAFPEDQMLAEEGIQACIVLPLINAQGEVIGVIEAAWRAALSEEEVKRAYRAMQVFVGRITSELTNIHLMSVLDAVASGPPNTTPRDAFVMLVEQLQRAMKVRTALVAETIEGDPDHFRLLSVCQEGLTVDDFENETMAYRDTPCKYFGQQDRVFFPSGLLEMFPDFQFLHDNNLNSFVGIKLRDADGTELGHIALMNDRTIHERTPEAYLMKLFATRLTLELKRHKSEVKRKQAEEALLIKHKTESLGLLAGAMAHDFNNILASMQGNAELAQAKLSDDHPAKNYVNAVEDGLKASADLVGQLLNYAKGRTNHTMAVFELNQIVSDAVALVPNTKKANKNIILDLSDESLCMRLDPSQMHQMLLNLIFNGLEAIDGDEGTISVTTRRQKVSLSERAILLNGGENLPEDCVVLEVADTGAGMSRETLKRIFDPFFTTKPEGRGFGMAAAFGIVSRHSGAVQVESKKNSGSLFRIFFPAQSPVQDQKLPETYPPAERRPSSGQNILVVDDEETVRRAIGGLLKLRGCEVYLADGYSQAQDLLKTTGPVSCAVIDMSMPERSGWDTLAMLRTIQPDLPAIMMSGFAVSAVDAGYPELADVEVLDKPFSKEKLYRAVFRMRADMAVFA